jgi:hypothetical protein
MLSVTFLYCYECRYAKCRYAECHGAGAIFGSMGRLLALIAILVEASTLANYVTVIIRNVKILVVYAPD